ncbi:MAG: glycosyltransferase family 1 protein [Deltaproteobacteria bacterium]|nr:glycosyltransferase family 1 protein [Deltaproteobacteria bacterium]
MKVLLLHSVDPSFEAYANIFNQLGHEAILLPVKTSFVDLSAAIDKFIPDFILINNTDLFSPEWHPDALMFEPYFEKRGIPVAIWEYEAPYFAGGITLTSRWRDKNYLKNIFFFSLDTYWVEKYKEAGHRCHFLPFGVDERVENFSPPAHLLSQFNHDLTYIGTCFIDSKPVDIEPSEDGLLHFFLDNFRHTILNILHTSWGSHPDNIAALQDLDDKFAPPIAQFLKMDLDDPYEYQRLFKMICDKLYDTYPQFFKISSTPKIIFEVKFLIYFSYYQVAARLFRLIDKGLRIYGEGGWNSMFRNYSHPIRRLSYPEMYAAFRASKIIFCYTKKLFMNNVHERVPHILGAGGFPLTDYRKDIDLMFEPGEVATYKSFEEAKSLIDFYKTHDSERLRIIEKGRKKVFAKHTYRKRVEEIISVIGKEFGISQAPHRSVIFTSNNEWMADVYHPPKVEF